MHARPYLAPGVLTCTSTVRLLCLEELPRARGLQGTLEDASSSYPGRVGASALRSLPYARGTNATTIASVVRLCRLAAKQSSRSACSALGFGLDRNMYNVKRTNTARVERGNADKEEWARNRRRHSEAKDHQKDHQKDHTPSQPLFRHFKPVPEPKALPVASNLALDALVLVGCDYARLLADSSSVLACQPPTL